MYQETRRHGNAAYVQKICCWRLSVWVSGLGKAGNKVKEIGQVTSPLKAILWCLNLILKKMLRVAQCHDKICVLIL